MSERFIPAIGRSVAVQEQYLEHLREKHARADVSCDLCSSVERQSHTDIYPHIGQKALQLTNDYFALIDNDYPYGAYDGQKVQAHHMIVPRQHIDFNTIKRDKKLRYMLADAEEESMELAEHAYTTILSRTSTSSASSIKAHAHTHLLVTSAPIAMQRFSIPEGLNDVRFTDGTSL